MKIRNWLLNFMMAGKLFEDKNQNEQKSVKSDNKIS
jgi:hypothetical protein